VGENAPLVRELACAGLAHLGVAIDSSSNERADGDADLTAPGAGAAVLVVLAREDVEIARQTRALLA
jgi:acetate kinase